MKDTYNRSRFEILNYLLVASVLKDYHRTHIPADAKVFAGIEDGKERDAIGRLVSLTCAPTSKYYLSWLMDFREGSFGGEWLLKSIEDGSLCWWSNVMVNVYGMPKGMCDYWKWTDRQWAFNDKFKKALRQSSSIDKPCLPDFLDNGDVILRTREIFAEAPKSEIKLQNWPKITIKRMVEFCNTGN